MNKVIDVINNRMSLRKYSNKSIEKEHLDTIIESAMRAPTAGNMMMYSMIVVEDEEKKLKLSKTCDNQPFIAKAPLVIIFLADMKRWYDYFEYAGVRNYSEKHNIKFEGPNKGSFLLATNDAIIAAQNAVIAAESLNIGSCYIGDIMENYEIHKEMFNLPELVFPVAMLCFGYYPEATKRIKTTRFDKQYIVFKDEYKTLTSNEFDDMYMVLNEKVSKVNKFEAENIGQYLYARKISSDFMKEMGRSIDVALKQWNEKQL
ncbi:nitroreductase family protein [Clostridium sp.]